MATRILIASTVLGSDTASITFSSIPQTFDDLLLVVSARSARAGAISDSLKIRFNGASDDTGMSERYLIGGGSTPTASSGTQSLVEAAIVTAATATANTFGSSEILIPNYSGSSANKSISSSACLENNATNAYNRATAGLWANTAAITQITLLSINAANIVTGSSAYLYGIKRS